MSWRYVTIKQIFNDFTGDDIKEIKIPAYVVKGRGTCGGEKEGCIVNVNDEFEKLTGSKFEDIRKKYCYEILECIQDQDECFVQVCDKKCDFRSDKFLDEIKACTLKNLWITIEKNGQKYKRSADICVFPFKTEHKDGINVYSVHLVLDKNEEKTFEEFESELKGKKVERIVRLY